MSSFWGVEIWPVVIAFARIGAMIMLLPGFGDQFVPARLRLALAMFLAIVLQPESAPMPATPLSMLGFVIGEIIVGLMIGAIARIVLSALTVAAQIIGLETGLAFAQTTDPTQGQAGVVIGSFLSLLGLTLIFSSGLHHLFLLAIRDSYALFPMGGIPEAGDAAELAVRSVAEAFRVGLQIAAPLLVAGFVFRLGLGVLSRLIPSIQVFMIAMPLNILGGLLIMMLGLSTGMLVWLSYVGDFSISVR
jgi:flagellar biosynthesis protein FliR